MILKDDINGSSVSREKRLLMNTKRFYLGSALLALALLLAGCPVRTTLVTPTPTFLSCVVYTLMDMAGGAAYLDANANGVLDPSDPPLSGAMFVLEYSDGTETREATDYTGQAHVGVTEIWSDDPFCKTSERRMVATRMEPPPGFMLLRRDEAGYLFAPASEEARAEATRRAANEELLRRSEATRSAKTSESLTQELSGDYISTNPQAEFRLTITPLRTYIFVNTEASGREHRNQGTLVIGGNGFWFDERGADSTALIPLLWGERRYLVEASALARICAADSGEPRTMREGYVYLRAGDWSRPAQGEPTLLDGRPACR